MQDAANATPITRAPFITELSNLALDQAEALILAESNERIRWRVAWAERELLPGGRLKQSAQAFL